MLFKRKGIKHKEKIIAKYIKLLEASKNDEQIFVLAEGIKNYHKDFNFDPKLIKQNGILRTTYRFYVTDRNEIMERLNKATSEKEKRELQECLDADNMYLSEISQLIIDYENAMIRKREIEKIEKSLTPEEIYAVKETIKSNNITNNEDESLKR